MKQPVRVTCVCLKCLGKRGILDYNFQRLGRSMDYCWLRSHYNSKSLSRCPRIWPLIFVKLSRLDWGQSILPRCQVVWTGASQSYRYFKAWLVLVKLTDLSSRLDWGQSTLPRCQGWTGASQNYLDVKAGLGPVKITEMSNVKAWLGLVKRDVKAGLWPANLITEMSRLDCGRSISSCLFSATRARLRS